MFVVGGEKIKKIAYVYVCRMGWGVAGGEVQRKHLQTSCRKEPVPWRQSLNGNSLKGTI